MSRSSEVISRSNLQECLTGTKLRTWDEVRVPTILAQILRSDFKAIRGHLKIKVIRGPNLVYALPGSRAGGDQTCGHVSNEVKVPTIDTLKQVTFQDHPKSSQ